MHLGGGRSVGGSVSMVGKDAGSLVKRHNRSGKTVGVPGSVEYFDTSVNTHMTCGTVTMPLTVLEETYGAGLCPGSLLSLRVGNSRTYTCDMQGMPGHESLVSAAHQLPRYSGPNDKESWDLCLARAGQAQGKRKREGAAERAKKEAAKKEAAKKAAKEAAKEAAKQAEEKKKKKKKT
jgi:hypothetical protein